MTDTVTLAHGAGGGLYRELVEEIFLPAFAGEIYSPLNDSAVAAGCGKIAMTTDSFVINPLFFPGGDIGRLAVSGTVNDLAVSGAVPAYLTLGMIIEAGFPVETLKKIVASIAETAGEAGVKIVTGDTKVVNRGKADGIYINTSGVGFFPEGRVQPGQRLYPGDVVIASAPLGCHGTAVMAAREGMDFSPPPVSDVRPLASLIAGVIDSGADIHAMRDPTRGGAASTLCEWAGASGVDISIDSALPVDPVTADISEILGIDPLFIANEGVVLIAAPESDAGKIISALHSHPYGENAAVIAAACEGDGSVWRKNYMGSKRRVVMPMGEILPRIC